MRRKIPSLQALACFDAAARHESYTRAAQELAMTQSAVSRQISALEAFLGIALFRRTRHGVALTLSGADYARQIAPRLQALERDTLDAMSHQGTQGVITLAAVPLLPRAGCCRACRVWPSSTRKSSFTSRRAPALSCLPTPSSTPRCIPARPNR